MTDWLLHAIFGLLLILPWQSVKGIRLLDSAVVRDSNARIDFYRSAVVSQWLLAAITLAVMWQADAQATAGMFASGPNADSLLIVALAFAALATQSPLLPAVHERLARSESARRALQPIRNILPRSEAEKKLWVSISFTAGICEEILFRGFLFFYLETMLGLGTAATIGVSSAVFAVGHVYQGTTNVIRVGIVGCILGVVYAVTDNLIWCIALHTFLDLGALRMGELVPADRMTESPASEDSE